MDEDLAAAQDGLIKAIDHDTDCRIGYNMTMPKSKMTPDQLKDAREQLGYTQEEMAGKLNTAYRTYQDWERGERSIPGILDVAIKSVKKKRKK